MNSTPTHETPGHETPGTHRVTSRRAVRALGVTLGVIYHIAAIAMAAFTVHMALTLDEFVIAGIAVACTGGLVACAALTFPTRGNAHT